MAVLPIHPSYKSAWDKEQASKLREYEDGSYDEYVFDVAIQEWWDFVYSGLDEDERDALDAFWQARKAATTTAGREFTYYDLRLTGEPDPTGASSLGRRTGIFVDARIRWTVDGECSYSTRLRVKRVA